MTQDPSAKAREVVSDWLRADFRGDVSLAGRDMLEQTIAAALTEAEQRGFERGVAEWRERNEKQAALIAAWMKKERVPVGYEPHEAYRKGDTLVILGYPETEEHNCDAMGCSSVSHVLWRGKSVDLERSALSPEREGKRDE